MVPVCSLWHSSGPLHRVRTDQILEFGWRYLLPLSLVNLIIATYLRLELYDGGNWNLWIPVVITTVSFGIFLLYIFDEDEEAVLDPRVGHIVLRQLSRPLQGVTEIRW